MIFKRIPRGEAIKKYCKEICCAGSQVDWRECPAVDCYLYRYRLGREIDSIPPKNNKKTLSERRFKD